MTLACRSKICVQVTRISVPSSTNQVSTSKTPPRKRHHDRQTRGGTECVQLRAPSEESVAKAPAQADSKDKNLPNKQTHASNCKEITPKSSARFGMMPLQFEEGVACFSLLLQPVCMLLPQL